MKTIVCFTLIVMLQFIAGSKSFAQNDCSGNKILGPSKLYPITELPRVDERDVMWHRRLWREIDLNEKPNNLFQYPKGRANCSFFDQIYSRLKSGVIKAYHPNDAEFTQELSVDNLLKLISDSVLNDNGELQIRPIENKDVIKIWLKEDWFFNSKYSKIDVRIVGLCPVKVKVDKDGLVKGYEQLFWLYFPHIRGVLTNAEVIKASDDKPRISFDDIFIKRMFDSYIIQKEDVSKQSVRKTKIELDERLENEKTKIYYFKRESNYWGN
jgi:gliding motility associated protien GldN